MTIAFSVFLIIWVLWVLMIVSLGDYKSIPMFTLVFVITPIAVTFLAVYAPLLILFSKTAREAALAEMKKGGK